MIYMLSFKQFQEHHKVHRRPVRKIPERRERIEPKEHRRQSSALLLLLHQSRWPWVGKHSRTQTLFPHPFSHSLIFSLKHCASSVYEPHWLWVRKCSRAKFSFSLSLSLPVNLFLSFFLIFSLNNHKASTASTPLVMG